MDDLSLRETEDRLRAGLRTRAARIDPQDRLDDVLEAAADEGRSHGWAALVVAAAVAALVGGLWLARPDPGPAPPPSVAATPSPGPSTAPASPPATPTPSASPSARPTPTSAPPAAASLPVYVVAPELTGAPDGRYGLRRLWRPTATTEEADRVQEAVDASLTAAVPGLGDGPWSGVRVVGVRVAADAVRVTLSAGPRRTGTTADDLALPAVGWTAQAVLGRGNLPVTVRTGTSTLGVVTRPPADRSWEVLADIWVTSPVADAVLGAGAPVVVRGEASVFEAALSWQLRHDGDAVRTGTTTASAGAPARGSYEIDLGRLEPGTYTVRVLERSARDGSDAADDVVTFRVR